jgi:hypothetical protein
VIPFSLKSCHSSIVREHDPLQGNTLHCLKRTHPFNLHNNISYFSSSSRNTSINPFYISGLVRRAEYSSYASQVQSNCTSLVLWGSNLGLTLGINYGSKVRAMVQFPPFQKSVIVGLVLGDGCIHLNKKNTRSVNAGFFFHQSLSHLPFFLQVWSSLGHYCRCIPSLAIRNRKGTITYTLVLTTRVYPCLTELYYLFYPQGEKVIPKTEIWDLLTPVALAYLISGDGYNIDKRTGGLAICTDRAEALLQAPNASHWPRFFN